MKHPSDRGLYASTISNKKNYYSVDHVDHLKPMIQVKNNIFWNTTILIKQKEE